METLGICCWAEWVCRGLVATDIVSEDGVRYIGHWAKRVEFWTTDLVSEGSLRHRLLDWKSLCGTFDNRVVSGRQRLAQATGLKKKKESLSGILESRVDSWRQRYEHTVWTERLQQFTLRLSCNCVYVCVYIWGCFEIYGPCPVSNKNWFCRMPMHLCRRVCLKWGLCMPLGASFFEDVPLVKFMYLVFICMPGGVTAGN